MFKYATSVVIVILLHCRQKQKAGPRLDEEGSILSGGQKQRVAIARAMVNDPDIILADEPTSALDSTTANEIIEVFKDLQTKGKTIIVVTHDINVAKKLDRIVTIVDGVISDNDIQ